MTDTTGKTWQLSGDTSKLTDHVGHQVRITGSDLSGNSTSSSSSSSGMGTGNTSSSASGTTGAGNTAGNAGAGQSSATTGTGMSGTSTQGNFNVKRVKMISSTCSTGTSR